MKILAVVLFVLSFISNITCQASRNEGWSKDIDFLVTEIKKQHYVYKSSELPRDFVTDVTALKTRIAEYTDERMMAEVGKLMGYLGDGHTYMLPFAASITQSSFLPLHFYEFSDGMFVIDADDPNSRLVGMKVKTIAGTTPDKFMGDMARQFSRDNSMGAKWIGPFLMRFRGVLEGHGLPKSATGAGILFEDAQGKTFTQEVNFIPVPSLRGIPKLVPPRGTRKESVPLYLGRIAENFWFFQMPGKNSIYFQFNQVRNAENESLAGLSKRLADELRLKKASLIVVDVRHNNGGNGDLTPPLVKVLKDFETEQKGKVVVLTGRNTFSAAQIFISRVDRETNAIFAGEPSSSKPNFVGEENEVVLPFSGMRGSISNRYHENIPGDTRQWIEPDLKVPMSSKDFFSNRDPLLEAVLKRYAK